MPLSPEAENALIDKLIARLFERLNDADGDGAPDALDADANGDGVSDDLDADFSNPAATPEDLDGDGLANEQDPHPLGDGDLERYTDGPPGGGVAGGASTASGSNSFVPGNASLSDEELQRYCNDRMTTNAYAPEGDEPERVRMSRVQCGQEVARYQRQTENLTKQLETANLKIAELERYARTATRERDLTGLLAEGFEFDLAEELADVADLDEKVYKRHLSKIRTRYSRSLANQPTVPVATDAQVNAAAATAERKAKGNAITPKEMSEIVRYCARNPGRDGRPLDFQEGVRRYFREQNGGSDGEGGTLDRG